MNSILNDLDKMISDPHCELIYSKDYELLIATVLSAQTTDKKVNEVSKVLWNKYDLNSLCNASISDLENILMILGTQKKKAIYIKEIARRLVSECNGVVPNDRQYLETLPGVGRKTCNVVLSNLYNEPLFAVDTHVERVSKRLGIADKNDSVLVVEEKLNKLVKENERLRRHHQFVLFGRYICLAKNPKCDDCLLKNKCLYYQSK